MQCPVCRQRSARRLCPALGRTICAVCCGTKRTVESPCPSDCGYLVSAQAHPPAAVRRQQDRDLGFMLALQDGLSEPQSRLLYGVLGLVARFQADPLLKLVDGDLADAASALAATFETASKGVIYEHRPNSLVAQRLTTDLKAFFANVESQAGRSVERDAAIVLRRLERGARTAAATKGNPTAALESIGRVVRAVEREQKTEQTVQVSPQAPSLLVRP